MNAVSCYYPTKLVCSLVLPNCVRKQLIKTVNAGWWGGWVGGCQSKESKVTAALSNIERLSNYISTGVLPGSAQVREG